METSRDADGSITNPVEESETGDIQGDGDRTIGDDDDDDDDDNSSCGDDLETRPLEVN